MKTSDLTDLATELDRIRDRLAGAARPNDMTMTLSLAADIVHETALKDEEIARLRGLIVDARCHLVTIRDDVGKCDTCPARTNALNNIGAAFVALGEAEKP